MKFYKFNELVRSWSVQILALIAVVPELLNQLGVITTNTVNTYTSIAALLGIVARSIKQPKLNK